MHLGNGFLQDRMPPVWGDIHQRHEHEAALLQAWMWQDQLIGRLRHLRVQRQIMPAPERIRVRKHTIPDREQIHIKNTRPPALGPQTTGCKLDPVQHGKQVIGAEICLAKHCCVHKFGTGTGRKSRGTIEATDRNKLNH